MSAHTETPLPRRIREAIATAPPALLTYAAFAVSVTIADYVLLPLASDSLQARIVPYTGWLASGAYSFTIFFAFALMFQQQRRPLMRFLGITVQMLLQIGYGVFQLSQIGRETFGNPYLTINPWQAVWTIAVPSIWIAALHSPHMNRFCRELH